MKQSKLMVIVLTINEMNYLVIDLLDDLVALLFVLIFVTLRFLLALLALIRPLHEKGPFPLNHIIYCNRRLLSSF